MSKGPFGLTSMKPNWQLWLISSQLIPPRPCFPCRELRFLQAQSPFQAFMEKELTEDARGDGRGDEGDEDYMGDLSRLLPSDEPAPPKRSSKKISNAKPLPVQPSNKKTKFLNWQERRKIEIERRQQEEDEQTLAKIEAPIPESNIGFKLLKRMGYTPGSALGKEGVGKAEPVGLDIRRSRAGIGRENPYKEKIKQEEIRSEKKRRKEESLMEEFGSRQKSQWRSRRIYVNFQKAKAALDQLENKEFPEPEKNEEEEEEGEKDEEEEEEITEEDLVAVLMKLRDEHNYCLFCGCQYGSKEELLSNCPGTEEDDH